MSAAARADARPDADLVGKAELAALFGLSASRFDELRDDWEARGFPAPLPWRRAPLMWRRDAVLRWRDGEERRAGCAGGGDDV